MWGSGSFPSSLAQSVHWDVEKALVTAGEGWGTCVFWCGNPTSSNVTSRITQLMSPIWAPYRENRSKDCTAEPHSQPIFPYIPWPALWFSGHHSQNSWQSRRTLNWKTVSMDHFRKWQSRVLAQGVCFQRPVETFFEWKSEKGWLHTGSKVQADLEGWVDRHMWRK